MARTDTARTDRPNIVVILADDMGYSDIGAYGSEINTPALDTLAHEGVRFTQMYNAARCCPTRASLLTGVYPHQAGVGHMIQDHGVGTAYQGYLSRNTVTIGEVLRDAGYKTAYAGKWHASPGIPVVGQPVAPPGTLRNPWPLSRGFERFYGTLAGACNYFNPHALFEQHNRVEAVGEDYYYTDAIGDHAGRMIDEAAADRRPLFLHVCFTAPHWPLHAKPDDIEAYRGQYRKGWDYVRTGRHEELRSRGLVDRRWEISPRDPDSREFGADPRPRQEWEATRMSVYAAQIHAMDRAIGRIIAALERNGMDENTVVMFLSDNGGCAEFLNEDGSENEWPGHYARTARPGEVCRVGNLEGVEPGGATTFMSYDLPWANVSNTPFRRYKHWVHEGGIATPFIVRWPGKSRAGNIDHNAWHVMDIMATCLELAGASYPSRRGDHDIVPLEGESFADAIVSESGGRDRPLFWEHEGNCAVRHGRWKLVKEHGSDWELYDMVADRTELHDLSRRNPEVRTRLADMYRGWAERCGVLEWPLRT